MADPVGIGQQCDRVRRSDGRRRRRASAAGHADRRQRRTPLHHLTVQGKTLKQYSDPSSSSLINREH